MKKLLQNKAFVHGAVQILLAGAAAMAQAIGALPNLPPQYAQAVAMLFGANGVITMYLHNAQAHDTVKK